MVWGCEVVMSHPNLLAILVLLGAGINEPLRAQRFIIRTSTWSPNDNLKAAIGELLPIIQAQGVTTTALESARVKTYFYREITDTGGIALNRWDQVVGGL